MPHNKICDDQYFYSNYEITKKSQSKFFQTIIPLENTKVDSGKVFWRYILL